MLDENVKVGAKHMTEFWNAKDALHILGAVMNNPRWSWSARSPDGSIVVIVLALLAGAAATAADAAGLPGPLPAPTIYSAPTPVPLAPPINPGPAIVPPAGLSPLLTQPGPVFATPQQSMPAYPSPQYPGSIGEQNTRAYHNRLLQQQWQRDRAGINPGTERSREIQQQLNQPSSC
jgi:hypothetical protein